MSLARHFLAQARSYSHLQTKRQRHAWVRAKLRYPLPRCPISSAAECANPDNWRFRRAA